MSDNISKWSKYSDLIKTTIENNSSLGYTELAREILGSDSDRKDIDLFRTYIKRNYESLILEHRGASEDQISQGNLNRLDGYIQRKNMSALGGDGKLMTIEQYCENYDVDVDEVKSFKLVTHTGDAFYNIQSHPIKGKAYEDFYKNLVGDLQQFAPTWTSRKRVIIEDSEAHLLVVDPADIHVGKLSREFETGDEYNQDIAVKRVLEGVEGLLQKSSGFKIDQIMFVGGNDILHIDTPKRTTTSGTPQDTDGMWYDNFLRAKQLYVDCVLRLLEVAPVHFVFNPSNHDYMTGFFLADVIKTYFRDNSDVTFDTSIKHRKYYTYGNNLIGTTHGDGAKQINLGPLMAHESADWSKCKHRYIYTHHVHHKTSKDMIGVTIESLRSPSATDSWHDRNGYTGVPKAVEAFLHSKENGQIARFVHMF